MRASVAGIERGVEAAALQVFQTVFLPFALRGCERMFFSAHEPKTFLAMAQPRWREVDAIRWGVRTSAEQCLAVWRGDDRADADAGVGAVQRCARC